MLKKSLRISLSAASMDCLAIIAYRQPISRYQIEAIRGVDSSGVLKNLLGKNLVKIKGEIQALVDHCFIRQLMYFSSILG